jgi:WD40 repeat protein
MQRCSECGAEISAARRGGLCTRCLLELGLKAAPASELAPRLQLPAHFGDYELLEEIAHGGMGIVFKARQVSLDRIVAVKLLLAGALSSPEYVKRFRVEASAAASLQHPNIVAIHEVGVHQGQHYLVMDYVTGPSLARLAAQQPLPVKRAAGYLKTVAEAVHYAHEHGILHRDLKPSNVLLDASDQPRVTDFGLAKRFEGDTELTLSGPVVGSPSYMPPEQAVAKRGKVSRRSDVYGMGAMLYHLLTGRAPFQAATLTETLDLVLHTEPVELRLLNPAAPRDLETICLKCLEKEPDKRYATALMVAEELGRFLEGKPVLARPVGRLAKSWRWCRRNPRLALTTGTAVLCLLLGLAGVTWQWRRAESQRARAGAEGLLARRNAYAADMKEVGRAVEDNNLGRARELLDAYRPEEKSEVRGPESKVDLRGWEWRYLWARCRGEERSTFCQYSNAVTALSFSPDGRWLAVRRDDDAVTVWDTVSKQSVGELRGAGYYKALSFAPQGNLLAWGNADASGRPVVSLWDVSTRNESGRLPLSNELASVAFSPDARTMATLDEGRVLTLWDVASQTVLTNRAVATLNFLAELFAPTKAKSTSSPAPTVAQREAEAQPRQPLVSEFDVYFRSHYGCVVFSPDGQWLAVGGDEPRIRLLDRITGKETVIAVPAVGGITALAFSPDSKRLAAGCGFESHSVYVWDLPVGAATPLAGHGGSIVGLAFSPDGQTLASVSTDQTLRLWDVNQRVLKRSFQGHTDEVWAVAWSPDGHDLVTGGKDGSVRYWDPAAVAAPAPAILNERAWLWGPAFSPDCQSLFTVNRPRGSVVRWNFERAANTWRRVEELPWLGTNHTSVDFSRDGRWLALGDGDGNVQVWDYPDRRLVTNLVSPGRRIFALMFSPSGKTLHCGTVVLSENRLVPKLYAADGWRELKLHGLKLDDALDGDLSPDDRTLAFADQDGTVFWWDFVTGQQQTLFRYHNAGHIQVAFSRDGRVFAASSPSGQISAWDVATRRIKFMSRGYGFAGELALSPDGRRVVACSVSPKDLITLWDVETGREVLTLPGERALIVHTGFSPDGNTLFATSFKGITQLWHAPSWEEIEAIEKKEAAR